MAPERVWDWRFVLANMTSKSYFAPMRSLKKPRCDEVANSQVTDKLRFPEGPVWLSDGRMLAVEIRGKALTEILPDGTCRPLALLEGGPNGAAAGPDGWIYVCNSGGWVYTQEANGWVRPTGQSGLNGWIERVRLSDGKVERLYDGCDGTPFFAPNDLVFDASGGFYFTDHGLRSPDTFRLGAVYYALPDGSRIHRVITTLVTPNGIGLSPDGTTLYVAETVPRRLWAFDLASPGELAGRQPWPSPSGGRLIAGLPGAAYLDSLAVDSAGHIAVASFDDCGIWDISPDGTDCTFLPFDDFYATNICFGGPDMQDALVTLSSTGRLVRMRWPRPGLKPHFC